MKKGFQLTKSSLIALYVAFAILGAFAAVLTYYYYKYAIIARGIVGLALLYLILNRNAFQNIYGPVEALLLHTNKIKDFITMFIGSLISTWAVMQVTETLLFYLRK